jgi:ABC-type antimicrobial peptide transport system permease subunit
MKRSEIIQEARRNFSSNTSRFVIFSSVTVLFLAGCLGVNLSFVKNSIENAYTFRDVGGSVQVMNAAERVSSEKCENLGKISGVLAAGAITNPTGSLVSAKLPDSPVPYFIISDQFVDLLDLQDIDYNINGVLVSYDAAERLGVKVGDQVKLVDGGAFKVQGIYNFPNDGRQGDLGFAVLVPAVRTETVKYSQCWANIWPQNDHLTPLMYQSLETSGGFSSDEQDQLFTLNSSMGQTLADYENYRTSKLGFLAVILFLTCIVLSGISTQLRRLQMSYLMHLGISKSDLIKIQLVEILPIVFISGLFSVLLSIYFGHTFGVWDQLVFYTVALKYFMASLIGLVCGIAIGTLMIKPKQFYNYFKSR